MDDSDDMGSCDYINVHLLKRKKEKTEVNLNSNISKMKCSNGIYIYRGQESKAKYEIGHP